MIYPNFLKEHDTIGVPAPSAGANNEKKENKFKHATKYFESLNYNLVLSKNINKCINGRSASKEIRAKEINDMVKNKDINMILCAAGGEFLIETLPYIDFKRIRNEKKLVAGFSDPTGILYPLTTKYDLATIYGSNFSSFGAEELHQSHKDFLNIICGKSLKEKSYELYEEIWKEEVTGLEGYNLTEKVYWKTLDEKEVNLIGRIIGGCIDIISEIAGTKFDGINEFNEKYKDDGIIWYFDNCELSMESLIRVLWRLNELNYFKCAKGIIFGRFGVEKSCMGYDVKTCLEDSILKELNIPIIYDADISHKAESLTIINGSIANIHVKNGKAEISFELK